MAIVQSDERQGSGAGVFGRFTDSRVINAFLSSCGTGCKWWSQECADGSRAGLCIVRRAGSDEPIECTQFVGGLARAITGNDACRWTVGRKLQVQCCEPMALAFGVLVQDALCRSAPM